MPLHTELLHLAVELVTRNPGAPVEGDLRRGVSTAYYALFHLLVHEATNRLVAVPSLRARVGRSFDHRIMRLVCEDYTRLRPDAAGRLELAGQIVPQGLQDVATSFVTLQTARYRADYDTAAIITPAHAQADVLWAQLGFAEWANIGAELAADTFLAELLCRGNTQAVKARATEAQLPGLSHILLHRHSPWHMMRS
jgi:hypothetical protein